MWKNKPKPSQGYVPGSRIPRHVNKAEVKHITLFIGSHWEVWKQYG